MMKNRLFKLLILLANAMVFVYAPFINAAQTFPSSQIIEFQGFINNAYLDNSHNLLKIQGTKEYSAEFLKSMYLLRFNETQKLLRSRKALQELRSPLKDQEHLPKLSENFKSLYNIGSKKIEPIQTLINQVEKGSTLSKIKREEQREELFSQLNIYAVVLNYLDRAIKFIETDLWENNKSLDLIVEKIRTEKLRKAGRDRRNTSRKKIKEALKKKFFKQLDLSSKLETLYAQKIFFLNRFPLLGIELKDPHTEKDLLSYKHLYTRMQKIIELPDLSKSINSNFIDFSKDQINFEYKDELLDYDPEVILLIAGNSTKDHIEETRKINESTHEVYDLCLEKALEGNHEFLEDLNKEIQFEDNTAPFLLLAANPAHWNELKRFYPWFSEEFFTKAEIQAESIILKQAEKQKFYSTALKYTSYGFYGLSAVFFITGVGGVLTAGAGAALRTAATRMALHRMMVLRKVGAMNSAGIGTTSMSAKVGYDWINHKRFSELATNLYIGARESQDFEGQLDKRLITDRDFNELIITVVGSILLLRGPIGAIVDRARLTFSSPAQGVISLGAKGEKNFRQTLSRISQSSLMSTKLIKNMHQKASAVFSKPKNPMIAWTNKLATKAKTTRTELIRKVKNSEYYQTFINNPEAFPTLQRELTVEFMAALTAEIMVRGDNFDDEIGEATFNIMFAMFVTFNIVSKSYRQVDGLVSKKIWPEVGKGNYTKALKNWGFNSVQLMKPIAKIATAFSAGLLLSDAYKHIVNGKEFSKEDLFQTAERIFWMTTVIGIGSPPRSELVYHGFNPSVDKLLRKKLGSRVGNFVIKKYGEGLKIPISIGNNSIGPYLLTSVLVQRGIQGDSQELNEQSFVYIEPDARNAAYLYPDLITEGYDLVFQGISE